MAGNFLLLLRNRVHINTILPSVAASSPLEIPDVLTGSTKLWTFGPEEAVHINGGYQSLISPFPVNSQQTSIIRGYKYPDFIINKKYCFIHKNC